MPASARRRAGLALRGGPLDLIDLIVVLIAAVLVAALIGYGVLSGAQASKTVSAVTVGTAASTPSASATSASTRIALIAPSDLVGKPIRAAIAKSTGAEVAVTIGSGYRDSKSGYETVAATLEADIDLVVVVPPASDNTSSPFELAKRISNTVEAVKKRAPAAGVLLVGPIASTARGARLVSLRNVVHQTAKVTSQHWVDPVTQGWVGAKVDASGEPTEDALTAAGTDLGAEVKKLLAD